MTKVISWVEIPAEDFERAVNFYKSILNIDFQIITYKKSNLSQEICLIFKQKTV